MERHKKVKIRVKEEEGEDKISSLPDDLIHNILSHLPIKVAVQTCVLSKRWIPIWATLPYLNFNLNGTDGVNQFGKFVEKFLSNRSNDTDVSTIVFTLFDGIKRVAMNKIIYYAISHSLQEFRIDSSIFPIDLPPCLFNCKSLKKLVLNSPWICNRDQSSCKLNSLTTLQLSGSILPDLPWSFPVLTTLHLTNCTLPLMSWSLPALTTLFLQEIIVVGEKSLSFEGFVYLKNLTLVGCRMWFGMDVFRLTLPSLTNLTIVEKFYESLSCTFLVSAPNVSCFKYSGHSPLLFVAEDGFPRLEDVNIDIDIDDFGGKKYSEEKKQIIFEQLISMFQELCRTKFLTLSPSTTKVLSIVQDLSKYQPCPFGNLKYLKLQQKTRKHSNPNISPKHVINYLLSSSLGAMVLMQEQSQKSRSSHWNSSSHCKSSSHRHRSPHQDRSFQQDRSSSHRDRSSSHRDRSCHSHWDKSSQRDRSSSHRDRSSSHRNRSSSHRDRSSYRNRSSSRRDRSSHRNRSSWNRSSRQ